jgi:diguanylate cyclase (GGDEF)-like protein
MGTCTGLLLLDLDRFKQINDTFGHHYGDDLLTQVGPRLASVVRDVDTVARLAGDEFVILLPEVGSVADATAVAAKRSPGSHITPSPGTSPSESPALLFAG